VKKDGVQKSTAQWDVDDLLINAIADVLVFYDLTNDTLLYCQLVLMPIHVI